MLKVKCFLTISLFVALAWAQTQSGSESVSSQAYIAQNRARYDGILAGYDAEIAQLRTEQELRCKTISVQRDFMAGKIAEANDKINPFAVLSARSNSCFNEQRHKIPNAETVSNTIATCERSCINNLNNVLNDIGRTRNSLDNYIRYTLNSFLTACVRKFTTNTFNHTICVVDAINTVNTFTLNNKREFATKLQQAHCTTESGLKAAFECSFNAIFNTGNVLGDALALVDRCTKTESDCAICATTPAAPGDPRYCSNVVNASWRPSDFLNATISNPFFGLDRTTSCVLFNFNKSLAPPAV